MSARQAPRNFFAAFGNIWALAGLLVSAVSIFNWLVGVIDLPLAAVVAGLLGSLRAALYPIVDFLFGWLELTDVWRDGIIVYAAVGAAMLRTLARGAFGYARGLWPDSLAEEGALLNACAAIFNSFFGIVAAYVLWPLAIVYIFLNPLEVESGDGDFLGFWDGVPVVSPGVRQILGLQAPLYVVRADLRVVFMLQLVAIAALLAIFALLNLVAAR